MLVQHVPVLNLELPTVWCLPQYRICISKGSSRARCALLECAAHFMCPYLWACPDSHSPTEEMSLYCSSPGCPRCTTSIPLLLMVVALFNTADRAGWKSPRTSCSNCITSTFCEIRGDILRGWWHKADFWALWPQNNVYFLLWSHCAESVKRFFAGCMLTCPKKLPCAWPPLNGKLIMQWNDHDEANTKKKKKKSQRGSSARQANVCEVLAERES